MEQQSSISLPQWNKTLLSSRLRIEYPIIQGPLGGLSTQRLAATVSNFGGLGSFGAHLSSPSAIKDAIAKIRALTTKPFAINLWISTEATILLLHGLPSSSRMFQPLLTRLADNYQRK